MTLQFNLLWKYFLQKTSKEFRLICALISNKITNPEDVYFEDPKEVIRILHDYYESEFMKRFEISSSEFIGKDYKSFYESEVEPECVLNLIKLNLIYLILKNEEERCFRVMEVT